MEPIDIAIEMEVELKAFYEKSCEESRTDLGEALFARLAKEEDFHAAKAMEIREFLKRGENPLAIEESLDRGLRIRTIFAKASQCERYNTETEIEIIQSALAMEDKSRRLYEDFSESAGTDSERRYFKALIHEEQIHHNALIEYRLCLFNKGWLE